MKNKKPQITELFAQAQEIKLTPSERWSTPIRIMGMPGFASDLVSHFRQIAMSEVQRMTSNFSPAAFIQKPVFAGIASLLLLAGTAGGALAFSHAVPGDILYPVKVSAERILSQALAVVPLPAAVWELERIHLKLADLQEWEEQHGFTEQTASAETHEVLVWHLATFQNLIERLEANGSTEKAAQLRSQLNEQLSQASYSKTIDTLMKQELPSPVRTLLEGLALPVPSSLITPAAGDTQENKEELFVVPVAPVSAPGSVRVPVPETAAPAAGKPAAQSSGGTIIPSISVPTPSLPILGNKTGNSETHEDTGKNKKSDGPVKAVMNVVEEIEEDLPDLHLPLGL